MKKILGSSQMGFFAIVKLCRLVELDALQLARQKKQGLAPGISSNELPEHGKVSVA